MESLLDTYFPGIPQKYSKEGPFTKFTKHPQKETIKAEKKYNDCIMCGACDGDISCSLVPCDTPVEKDNVKVELPKTEKIRKKEIEVIINEIVGKLKDNI